MILALLASLAPAQADQPDDQYIHVYTLMTQGDTYSSKGNTALARAKYLEARRALLNLQQYYPNWNQKMVTYRLGYLDKKIAALTQPAPAASEEATETQAQSGNHMGGAPGKIQFKLLDAGGEPRQVLRLHPAAGDHQTLTMTMGMAMTMQMGEQAVPAIKIPTMRMEMDATVRDVSADGDISYDMVMNDSTVITNEDTMPMVAEAMKTSLDKLKGLSGTGKLSNRGFSEGTNMKFPIGADPEMVQTMDQMKESLANASSPLPEEAVGPGAKWQVKMKLKSQGMTIDQTINYELLSVDNDQIRLGLTLTQNAAKQKIESPNMPGMKIDLTRMTGTGKGTNVVNLAKILPVSGTLDSHSEMVMGMDAGPQGKPMNMTMKMDIMVGLESN